MKNSISSHVLKLLQKHQLRVTAMRIDVMKIFLENKETALSNQELELELIDSDRVTLYRTLKTFEKKGIIHQAVDGSGTTKYAICHDDCSEHEHLDDHAHFHCTSCGKTLCLEKIESPEIELPKGFTSDVRYLIVQGKCDKCKK
jgi:Fur family ferric uptake transcriptional regulator